MRLHVIRHGDPDYENDALTPLGQREAEALAQRMAHFPLETLYASPLGRAQQTAAYTAERTGLPVHTLPWAQEVRLPGMQPDTDLISGKNAVWNLTAQQLKDCESCPEGWLNAPLLSPPQAQAAFDEIGRGWSDWLAGYGITSRDGVLYAAAPLPRMDMALFCHHGLCLSLLSIIMEVPATVLWRSLWLAPSSVTTLLFEELDRSRVQVRITTLSDTSHLYAADMADENHSGLMFNTR